MHMRGTEDGGRGGVLSFDLPAATCSGLVDVVVVAIRDLDRGEVQFSIQVLPDGPRCRVQGSYRRSRGRAFRRSARCHC